MSNNEDVEQLGKNKPLELVAETLAIVASAFSPLGGPVSVILSGATSSRKMKRVTDAVKELALDLKLNKEKIADEYVQSEDFEELLEEALKRISSERNEQKRKYYKNIIVSAAKKSDAKAYDEQLVFLNVLEQLLPVHLDILAAIYDRAPRNGPTSSSRFGNLRAKLPGMSDSYLRERLEELDAANILNAQHTELNSSNASNLESLMTPKGERFIAYLKGDG